MALIMLLIPVFLTPKILIGEIAKKKSAHFARTFSSRASRAKTILAKWRKSDQILTKICRSSQTRVEPTRTRDSGLTRNK